MGSLSLGCRELVVAPSTDHSAPANVQIDLSYNYLHDEGAKALAPAIADNPSVTSIDVGFNSIGQAAALEMLAAMKGKNMVSIGMARCELGVEGAKVVAETILGMALLTQVLPAGISIGTMGSVSCSHSVLLWDMHYM